MMFLLLVILAFLARAYMVLASIKKQRDSPERSTRTPLPIKTLVVLGSGGHTTEMLQMIQQLNPKVYDPLIYVIASTDDTSERRVQALGGRLPSKTYYIPRSREVGQSYLTSIASTLHGLFCVARSQDSSCSITLQWTWNMPSRRCRNTFISHSGCLPRQFGVCGELLSGRITLAHR
jgi:hypothetical protein